MSTLEEKTNKLREIRDEVIELTTSPLYEFRIANNYHAVLGEGNHDADIMFIGEAPGRNEAEQGRPFCGQAGKLLDELLEGIGIPREKVYITNIVKDRPPENRDPTPEEIELYVPFLDRQIEIIQPKVLVALGRHAMAYLMKKYNITAETITNAHGKIYDISGLFGQLKFIPMYHPAAAIYTRSLVDTLKKDFELLKEFYTA